MNYRRADTPEISGLPTRSINSDFRNTYAGHPTHFAA